MIIEGSLGGVAVSVLNDDIIVSKFELQSSNDIYFRANFLVKGMNTFILTAMC